MKQVLGIVHYNFFGYFRNPKVIFTFLLEFVLSFLLTGRIMVVMENYDTPVQAVEPFLWTFGDGTAVLLSSLLLLLLFSDLPKMTPVTPYQLIRTTKKKWLLGQFIYIILVTALYTVLMLIFTSVLCMKDSYPGNLWSETAAMLGYSELGKNLQVPSTVRVMESISPYGCMLQVFLLLFCYSLTLGFVILVGNLYKGKTKGMVFGLLYSVFGFLLAFFMERNTTKSQILEEKLRRTQDDSKERSLLLSQKNKALQEKQDYEIYNATLKERNRIAREIHDNVGHVLSRSILMVGAAKTINEDPGMTAMLKNLEDSLNHAMNSIRNSVHDLHDEAVNLEEVEKSLVREFTFCPVQMVYDMTREVPREVKYCFISITKEAFANIMKHSNATKVQLILREHPGLYQLCIEDNGKDAFYDPEKSGIGIANMKERVNALGGTLQIFTDKGFRIFITIPKCG